MSLSRRLPRKLRWYPPVGDINGSESPGGLRCLLSDDEAIPKCEQCNCLTSIKGGPAITVLVSTVCCVLLSHYQLGVMGATLGTTVDAARSFNNNNRRAHEFDTHEPAKHSASGVFALTCTRTREGPPGHMNSVELWDPLSNELLWSAVYYFEGFLAYAPVAKKVVGIGNVSGAHYIKIWDLELGSTRSFPVDGNVAVSFRLNNSGTKLLKQSHIAGAAYDTSLWNVHPGQKEFTVATHVPYEIYFSDDDSQIIGITFGGEIGIWNADTGREVFSFELRRKREGSLRLRVSGMLCSTLCDHREHAAWDVSSGKRLFYRDSEDEIIEICFGPNNESILTVSLDLNSGHELTCWNLSDGSRIFSADIAAVVLSSILSTPTVSGFCLLADKSIRHLDTKGAELSCSRKFEGVYTIFASKPEVVLM
jgi:WD40 repeat protein